MFFLNFATRASGGGRGWFVSLLGGVKLWLVFRIVFGNEGLFHGQAINGGLVCPRAESFLNTVMSHEAKILLQGSSFGSE